MRSGQHPQAWLYPIVNAKVSKNFISYIMGRISTQKIGNNQGFFLKVSLVQFG